LVSEIKQQEFGNIVFVLFNKFVMLFEKSIVGVLYIVKSGIIDKSSFLLLNDVSKYEIILVGTL
jgi:hypothetical protein